MRGWLIYDNEGARRNEWFIARLIQTGARYGLELSLKIYPYRAEFDRVFTGEKPDLAIVRTICPPLNAWLEGQGIRSVNNAKTALIANDKWRTYALCKQKNIPVLDTWQGEPNIYPAVIKTVDGHGGKEVFWANGKAEYAEIAQTLSSEGRAFISQQPSRTLGKDMRVYVIGGEIVAAVLRTSESDFRSNFSLGGKVERVSVNEEQRAIINAVCKELNADYIGVDLLPDGTRWVLNEIEDSAGARMLYECTDIDVAEAFVSYLVGGYAQ